MDPTKKRVLSQDFEPEEAKRLSSRPIKPPVKRRKTEDSLGITKCSFAGGDQKAGSKGKRQAWTTTAIEAFFEGLYQHGKHFNRILKYMQSKQKKFNDLLIPNLTKDQVRFFYYRTWHKVETHLEPSQQYCDTLTSCEPSKKIKQSLSSGDCPSVHMAAVVDDVITHADYSTEEYEVADEASPKKSTEVSLSDSGGGDPSTLSPTGIESSDKISEQLVGASPSASIEKGESKVKYVVVNGVKQSVDVVALICYHKLKQKCQVDNSFWKRLSELVYQGTTTIPSRVKGKRRIQIKVPNCGALRGKLPLPTTSEDPAVEQMDENPVAGDGNEICEPACTSDPGTSNRGQLEADVYLNDEPLQVILELRPLTSATWAHLQGLSLNPRIRVTIGASKQLVDLLQMLTTRWKVDKSALNIYHKYTTVTSKCVPGLSSDDNQKSSLDGTCTKQLQFNSEITICDLHNYFGRPDCVQLLYCIPHVEEDVSHRSINSTSNKLKVLLKIVELVMKGKDSDSVNQDLVQQRSICTPSKVMSTAHQSPKVVEYMKSLEKRSPRRSPLAKYYKLKARSPYRVPVSQLKPKRVQLDFTSPPSRAVATTSESLGKASPQIIQLSKPTARLTSESSTLEETTHPVSCSFSTVKVQDVLSRSTDSTRYVSSSSVQALSGDISSPVAVHSKQLHVSPNHILPTGPSNVPPMCAQLSQESNFPSLSSPVSLQPHTTITSQHAPMSALALLPGHHVLRPKPSTMPPSVNITTVTSSVPYTCATPALYHSASPLNTCTCSTSTSTSVPIVSTLKPFSKPRRTKKVISRTGQTRQLVPRPLPFLPQPQLSSGGQQCLHNSLSGSLNMPLASDQANPVHHVDRTGATTTRNTLMLTLLQAVMQQQRKLKQQIKLNSNTSTSQVVQTAINKEPNCDIPANDDQDDKSIGDLDNLLEVEQSVAESEEEIFNTSSDTVNNLLRGLSCTKETESIKRLTEETANVLPTFTKVLDQSSGPLTQGPDEVSLSRKSHQMESEDLVLGASPLPEGAQNESSMSVSELLGNLTDSMFKQISEKEDILENVNFSDVFSHLREEVMRSPEKLCTEQDTIANHQSKDQSDESVSSIGCLLDYLNSGEEIEPLSQVDTKSSGASQMGDSTYRSLMEENSVDYIQKFKELASSMNHNETF